MGTASTKSRARKVKRAARRGAERETTVATQPPPPPPARVEPEREAETTQPQFERELELPPWLWPAASALILTAATIFRLYNLSLRPFHHDEGVNGFFLINLYRNHVYTYDPSNYHGPTLYYFALASSLLFGLNDFAVRFVPAIFGVATVWLMLTLRRYLGTIGALTAAALMAVSPAAVFYSRYFIHESLFVFFSVAIVVAAARYYETARPTYLMLASASCALLFGTKETALITAGVFLIAVVATHIYQYMRGTHASQRKSRRKRKQSRDAATPPTETGIKAALRRMGEPRDLVWLGLAALALFIFLHVLFYSSFFTHAKGVNDSFATFKIWVRTGTSEFHAKPFYTYFEWLWAEEAALFLLGLGGTLIALWRATNRFAIFSALWAIGIIAAYALVPYKTPWLVLSFIPPLAIMAGYFINGLYRSEDNPRVRAFALGVALVAVAVGAYQTVQLNFYNYDNEGQYPYVYAHTQRPYLALVGEINAAARRAGTKEKTTISIASPEYWPMPWYMREFKGVAYPGRVGAHNEQIVVCSDKQMAECEAALSGRYRRVGSYPMRSGVTLILYERNDVPQ